MSPPERDRDPRREVPAAARREAVAFRMAPGAPGVTACFRALRATGRLEVPAGRGLWTRLRPHALGYRCRGVSAPCVSLAGTDAAVASVMSWAAARAGAGAEGKT